MARVQSASKAFAVCLPETLTWYKERHRTGGLDRQMSLFLKTRFVWCPEDLPRSS